MICISAFYHTITDRFWYNEKLINDKKYKAIREYFKTYFDVDKVDEFTKKNMMHMYWNWNQTLDPEFVKVLKIKHPDWLIENYFNKYKDESKN